MIDLTDEGKPSLSLLKNAVEKYDVVMADPSWEQVFLMSKIPFYVVVPSFDRKEEFIANFRERWKKGLGGGDDNFCRYVGNNWAIRIRQLMSLPSISCTVLEKGKWLKDVIDSL